MSKLQILCATMHQNDFSKIKEMNIRCDVVFANQADRMEKQVMEFDGHQAQMITTDTRGVGVNRNIAMLHADGDVLLFADDDLIYDDHCEARVLQAFEEHPDADVIVFELDFTKEGQVYFQRRHKAGKLSIVEALKYGTCFMAVRRVSITRANIWFHTEFGGGCRYSSGEDSLFLRDCFRKKLKIYKYKYCLGQCRKDDSSWFEGYTEKYFTDKGVWLSCAFPVSGGLLVPLLAYKWRKQNPEFGIWKIARLMQSGFRKGKKGLK